MLTVAQAHSCAGATHNQCLAHVHACYFDRSNMPGTLVPRACWGRGWACGPWGWCSAGGRRSRTAGQRGGGTTMRVFNTLTRLPVLQAMARRAAGQYITCRRSRQTWPKLTDAWWPEQVQAMVTSTWHSWARVAMGPAKPHTAASSGWHSFRSTWPWDCRKGSKQGGPKLTCAGHYTKGFPTAVGRAR